MIYDCFEDIGADALAVYVAITALCFGLFLFLLVTGIVRMSRKKPGGSDGRRGGIEAGNA